jgi:hypothetical protein
MPAGLRQSGHKQDLGVLEQTIISTPVVVQVRPSNSRRFAGAAQKFGLTLYGPATWLSTCVPQNQVPTRARTKLGAIVLRLAMNIEPAV